MDEHNIRVRLDDVKAGRLSRRAFLEGMVGLGLAAPVTSQACVPTASTSTVAPAKHFPVNYCQYHGYADLPFTGTILAGGAGRFRTGIQNNRLVMACPDGHVWPWLMVWRVMGSGTLDNHGLSQLSYFHTKYKGADDNGRTANVWSNTQLRRLSDWGFTGIQSYSTGPVMPFANGQTMKFPFMWSYRPTLYGSSNAGGLAPGPFKNLFQTNPTYHDASSAHFPDIYDSNYQIYLRAMLTTQARWLIGYPYLVGMNIDDLDQLRGFGAGPDFPAQSRNNAHLGWITAISAPWVPSGDDFTTPTNRRPGNTAYRDPTHVTKKALRDFLVTKYGTIAALNTSWRSSYTTFDEQTPHTSWGAGSGFMDEDGRHVWMGGYPVRQGTATDHGDIRSANANVKVDLDAFLYNIAAQYFSVCRTEVKRLDPNMLYCGPMDIGSWGAPAFAQVLQAAGKYCDVIHGLYADPGTTFQAIYDFMFANIGNSIPFASWVGFPANLDSAMYYFGANAFPTQAARGQYYAAVLDKHIKYTTGGRFPWVGLSWWGFYDQPAEGTNWGLVSYKDNAYDGREDVAHSIVDPYGNATIPEDKDFGDFLTSVKAANAQTFSTYQSQLGRGPARSNSRSRLTIAD
jgi:hypothetical protein